MAELTGAARQRFRAVPLIEWSASVWSLVDGEASGDGYLVKTENDWALVAAVDGLGHGRDAATAAKLAVAFLDTHAGQPLTVIVSRCHEALRNSRGAVISLAAFNRRDSTMAWMGVGNIEGVLLRLDTASSRRRETILLRGGIVGHQLPPLQTTTVPILRGDTLIFATDGIREGFADGVRPGMSPQQILDGIAASYRKGTDDALVVVARYLGRVP